MYKHSIASNVSAVMATALLVLAVSGSALAWAAPSPTRASVKTLGATLDDDASGQTATLLISGELPANAPLPATIELPIPSGSAISWAGEILGGPPANDPQVKYAVIKGKSFDLARITLTRARIGQVELPATGAVTVNGSTRTLSARLPIPYPVGLATVTMKAPSDAKVTKRSPGLVPTPGPSGLTFYSVTRSAPRSGVLTAELTYTGGTFTQGTGSGGASGVQGGQGGQSGIPSQQQPAASSGSALVLPAALAALAALAVAAYFLMRGRTVQTAAAEGVEEDVEPDEEPDETAEVLDKEPDEEPDDAAEVSDRDEEEFFFYEDGTPEASAAATAGATASTKTAAPRPPTRKKGRSSKARRRR